MHDTPTDFASSALENRQSPFHVGADVVGWGHIGIGDADEGGQMEDGVDVMECGTSEVGVRNVSQNDFQVRMGEP